MSDKDNEVYYGNCVNLSGLYNDKPIKCTRSEYPNLKDFYDGDGDFCINPNHLEFESDGRVQFASKNKHDVEMWTKGALAVMRMLNKWSR